MFFQKINRSDPEKVFIVVKNNWSTAAITKGQAVIFDYASAADGVSVTRPTTTAAALFAGIVEDASIAASSYGIVQVYGHNANALVSGGTDVAIGDKLSVKTAVFNLIKAAGTLVAGESGLVVAGQAFTTSTAAAKKVFIRAL